jgi:NADH-quinone oxidoreductase subunit C
MRDAEAILASLGAGSWDAARPCELSVAPGELVGALSSLKKLGDFILLDIDAVDRPEGFDLAYRLLDRGGEGRVGILTVRTRALRPGEGGPEPSLPSIAGVWKAADVLEREVWDLMGVGFEGRGELKRILCKDDFVGHPLRKDFVLPVRPRFMEGERA